MPSSATFVYLVRPSSVNAEIFSRLYAVASEGRRARADRYVRQEDAVRCLLGEALLRYALRCHGVMADVEEQILEGGKPYVAVPKFHFNLSHGGDLVVLAKGASPIGVDVELISPRPYYENVAEKYFSDAERRFLFSADVADQADRDARFTLLWTRKESYVKYTGQGLHGQLTTFSVDATVPRGCVRDLSGIPIDVQIESIFPDSQHVVSLCGHFEQVVVRHLAVNELVR